MIKIELLSCIQIKQWNKFRRGQCLERVLVCSLLALLRRRVVVAQHLYNNFYFSIYCAVTEQSEEPSYSTGIVQTYTIQHKYHKTKSLSLLFLQVFCSLSKAILEGFLKTWKICFNGQPDVKSKPSIRIYNTFVPTELSLEPSIN